LGLNSLVALLGFSLKHEFKYKLTTKTSQNSVPLPLSDQATSVARKRGKKKGVVATKAFIASEVRMQWFDLNDNTKIFIENGNF